MKALCAAVGATMALSSVASADLVYEFSYGFSGPGVPMNPGPWMTATFTNVNANTVDLLLEGHLDTTEFVSGFYFNFDPALSIANLQGQFVSSNSTGTPTVNIATNAFQADGDGQYDILLSFPTAQAQRFNGTDTASFRFTSSDAIDCMSFDFWSNPAGGHGPFPAAAHIQGTASGSVWVTVVPLPPAAWAGLASLTGVFGIGYVRRRSFRA